MIYFYDVDENYINYLKTIDRQIPDIKYNTNNKFVCGIVLSLNGIDYYAPISHLTKLQQTNMAIKDKDRIISTIRFSFMFPALDSVLKKKDFNEIGKKDINYANLLRTEYQFCSSHEEEIRTKAEKIYKIGCNKQHRLNYTCCDFKHLEQEYKNYKKQNI